MAAEPSLNVINFNEASEYCAAIDDPITRNLSWLVMDGLIRNLLAKNPLPDGQFDVLYFAKLVQQAMAKHTTIQRYLDGEDDLWPS